MLGGDSPSRCWLSNQDIKSKTLEPTPRERTQEIRGPEYWQALGRREVSDRVAKRLNKEA